MMSRYQELAKLMDMHNGGKYKLANIVWNGSYRVPKVWDEKSCEVVKKTKFWGL